MFLDKYWAGLFILIIISCQSEKKSTPAELEYDPSVEEILKEYPESASNNSEDLEATTDLTIDDMALIDPYHINEELLIRLIEKGINQKRVQEGRMLLKPNPILQRAAIHQNNYQVNTGQLSHTQNDPNMRQVQDRVAEYGGAFRTVGENVQFQGFQVMFRNGQQSLVRPAYREAADEIVKNWINSPGHYRNLVNDQFDMVGTAIAWSEEKNAIFATQVFGG